MRNLTDSKGNVTWSNLCRSLKLIASYRPNKMPYLTTGWIYTQLRCQRTFWRTSRWAKNVEGNIKPYTFCVKNVLQQLGTEVGLRFKKKKKTGADAHSWCRLEEIWQSQAWIIGRHKNCTHWCTVIHKCTHKGLIINTNTLKLTGWVLWYHFQAKLLMPLSSYRHTHTPTQEHTGLQTHTHTHIHCVTYGLAVLSTAAWGNGARLSLSPTSRLKIEAEGKCSMRWGNHDRTDAAGERCTFKILWTYSAEIQM